MDHVVQLGRAKRFAKRGSIRQQRIKCDKNLDIAFRNLIVSVSIMACDSHSEIVVVIQAACVVRTDMRMGRFADDQQFIDGDVSIASSSDLRI